MVDATEEGGVTVVLRVVRSFPHRNIRPLVLKGVPLSLTAQQVMNRMIRIKAIAVLHQAAIGMAACCRPPSQSTGRAVAMLRGNFLPRAHPKLVARICLI